MACATYNFESNFVPPLSFCGWKEKGSAGRGQLLSTPTECIYNCYYYIRALVCVVDEPFNEKGRISFT